MSFGEWLLMTASLIAVGFGGLKTWGRIESKRLDRKYPEKKA